MFVNFSFRRVLMSGLAVGGLALVLLWPGWRSVLAQGYTGYPPDGEAFLGCSQDRRGALVVVLADAANATRGESCANALLRLEQVEGWVISKETQFLSGAKGDDDDGRRGSGFATLFRLSQPFF